MTVFVLSKRMEAFATVLLTSFLALTTITLNSIFISANFLFKGLSAFSIKYLRILPASVHYPIPKPPPHFKVLLIQGHPTSWYQNLYFLIQIFKNNNYHELGNFFSYISGVQKSEIELLAGPCFFFGSRKNSFLASS